jgi:hypothetical protein
MKMEEFERRFKNSTKSRNNLAMERYRVGEVAQLISPVLPNQLSSIQYK